ICGLKDVVNKGKRSAFLFLDIDDFKLVNDYLGHYNGDILLKEISKRLSSCITQDDHVIRLSGDEFIIIINELDSNVDLDTKTNQILKKITEPYIIQNKEIHISSSIGIAI